MRRLAWIAVFASLSPACFGEDVPVGSITPSATLTTQPSSPSTTTIATNTETPPPVPVDLPAGVPRRYGPDAEPGDLPLEELVPKDADVTGQWFATLSDGRQVVLVAFSRGGDVFGSEQALLEWVRSEDTPHWRPVFAVDEPPEAGVLGITVRTGDATGDGSPDALSFAATGGSGACGTWRLIDLSGAADVWDLVVACDTSLEFSTDPVGLSMTEAIFKPGDAHCCPSRFRISQLEFDGTTMIVTDSHTEPASP